MFYERKIAAAELKGAWHMSDELNEIDDAKSEDYCTYTSNNCKNKKHRKRHIGLKVTAFVLCAGIVGAGTSQVISIAKEHNEKNKLEEFKADEFKGELAKQVNATGSNIPERKGDMPSLIDIAARGDAKPLPDIVDEIMPSVVGVSSTFEAELPEYDMFGFTTGRSQSQKFVATGTGIIISEDGYIATNAHVIYDSESEYKAGKAVGVSILFSDESEHEAKIIAYDIQTDLAVLKVDSTDLTPATFGDSDELRVGELVIAIGNPLGFDLFGSVTSGIVSALNREISINDKDMTLIQTDAAINSGNSGGPLLNSCGQVIGINSAKMSSNYGTASIEGLGFAIPINEAKEIIDDLINYNYVKGRPQIGITTIDIDESQSSFYNIPMGVYVRTVEEGSAADEAGLQVGDVIIDVDGTAVKTGAELSKIKNEHKAGETITVTVTRHGKDIKLNVVLQEANLDEDASDEDIDEDE